MSFFYRLETLLIKKRNADKKIIKTKRKRTGSREKRQNKSKKRKHYKYIIKCTGRNGKEWKKRNKDNRKKGAKHEKKQKRT